MQAFGKQRGSAVLAAASSSTEREDRGPSDVKKTVDVLQLMSKERAREKGMSEEEIQVMEQWKQVLAPHMVIERAPDPDFAAKMSQALAAATDLAWLKESGMRTRVGGQCETISDPCHPAMRLVAKSFDDARARAYVDWQWLETGVENPHRENARCPQTSFLGGRRPSPPAASDGYFLHYHGDRRFDSDELHPNTHGACWQNDGADSLYTVKAMGGRLELHIPRSPGDLFIFTGDWGGKGLKFSFDPSTLELSVLTVPKQTGDEHGFSAIGELLAGEVLRARRQVAAGMSSLAIYAAPPRTAQVFLTNFNAETFEECRMQQVHIMKGTQWPDHVVNPLFERNYAEDHFTPQAFFKRLHDGIKDELMTDTGNGYSHLHQPQQDRATAEGSTDDDFYFVTCPYCGDPEVRLRKVVIQNDERRPGHKKKGKDYLTRHKHGPPKKGVSRTGCDNFKKDRAMGRR